MFANSSDKTTGWVAEYCPVCRDLQPVELRQFTSAQVRNSLMLAGRSFTHARCSVCGYRAEVNPADYLAILGEPPSNVLELMQRTNPRLPLRVANRINWEHRAVSGDLPAPERAEAIREPFLVLDYLVPRRNPDEISWKALFIFMAAFSVFAAIVGGITFVAITQDELCGVIAVIGGIVPALGISLYLRPKLQMQRDGEVFREQIEPMLATALRPLRPSLEELESVQKWAIAASHPMGPHIAPARLLDRVRSLPDRSLINADHMKVLELADAMYGELTTQPEHVADGEVEC